MKRHKPKMLATLINYRRATYVATQAGSLRLWPTVSLLAFQPMINSPQPCSLSTVCRRLLPLAIAITATLAAQPMLAQAPPVHNLVITELSSTNLTATYDGSTARVTVKPGGVPGEAWTVDVTSTQPALPGPGWTEPSGSSFNVIAATGTGPGIGDWVFQSDETSVTPGPLASNGVTITGQGTDTTDNGSISITFNDNGDVASAPDSGSTFCLFCLALAALVGVSRLRSLRLA